MCTNAVTLTQIWLVCACNWQPSSLHTSLSCVRDPRGASQVRPQQDPCGVLLPAPLHRSPFRDHLKGGATAATLPQTLTQHHLYPVLAMPRDVQNFRAPKCALSASSTPLDPTSLHLANSQPFNKIQFM